MIARPSSGHGLDREVEDVIEVITAAGGAGALSTTSSGADIALAAASVGADVTALVLYGPPPFFAGSSFAALRLLLVDGKNDEAMVPGLLEFLKS